MHSHNSCVSLLRKYVVEIRHLYDELVYAHLVRWLF